MLSRQRREFGHRVVNPPDPRDKAGAAFGGLCSGIWCVFVRSSAMWKSGPTACSKSAYAGGCRSVRQGAEHLENGLKIRKLSKKKGRTSRGEYDVEYDTHSCKSLKAKQRTATTLAVFLRGLRIFSVVVREMVLRNLTTWLM